jgi:hypothetical protein
VRAVCDHGLVVNRLHALLEKQVRGARLVVRNSRQCDLIVASERGIPRVVFEAKTDTSTDSIYKAVGQLLLNAEGGSCRRVLVVPQSPRRQTELRLRRLGIRCIRYRETGGQVNFVGMGTIVRC